MAINNITSVSSSPLETIPVVSTYTGALQTQETNGCSVHHGNISNYYPTVNQSTGKPLINHQDINSLKYIFQQLSADFRRSANAGAVYSISPNFTNKTSGSLIELTEWSQIRRTVNAFRLVDNINNSSVISESFHNDLVAHYNDINNDCLCNSDCACNNVCSCNTDCGCDYSDRRLKENIVYYNTSDTILDIKIKFYNFTYIQSEKLSKLELPKTLQYGVIAQELIESGLEEFVDTEKGFFKVNYKKLSEILKGKRYNESI